VVAAVHAVLGLRADALALLAQYLHEYSLGQVDAGAEVKARILHPVFLDEGVSLTGEEGLDGQVVGSPHSLRIACTGSSRAARTAGIQPAIKPTMVSTAMESATAPQDNPS